MSDFGKFWNGDGFTELPKHEQVRDTVKSYNNEFDVSIIRIIVDGTEMGHISYHDGYVHGTVGTDSRGTFSIGFCYRDMGDSREHMIFNVIQAHNNK